MRTIVYNRKIKTKWSQYVPLVQRIMNASVHSSIGVSPAQLVFGNSVRLDRNLLPVDHVPLTDRTQEYLANLLTAQKDILEIAMSNQKETDQFHISERGGKEITEFPINSYVLVNYEGADQRPPTKLHTFLRGPLRIVNHNGPIYTLENIVTNKLEDFHVKLLHPFKFDTADVDPHEVAEHDEDYYGIIEVRNHRFTNASERRSDLEFLILFQGDRVPSWQPWSIDLSKNEKIHQYLNQHQMRKFIPIRYTYPKDHPLYEKPVRKENPTQPAKRVKRRKMGRY